MSDLDKYGASAADALGQKADCLLGLSRNFAHAARYLKYKCASYVTRHESF